jgi:Domain of unknown function (DUF932)
MRFNSQFANALTVDALRHYVPSAFATSPHSSRSSRYAYIPTSEVIDGLMAQGFAPFKAVQSRSKIEGKTEYTKHMIRFRHADAVAAASGNIPEVVLINSHDGTSAYKLLSGIFRMICTNGLIAWESKQGELSIQHKGNVVHQVIEGSFEIIGQSQRALGTIENWSNLELSAGEQSVFAEAAHTLRFADADGKIDTPITASQLLTPRRMADRSENGHGWSRPAPDLYRTLNVVQENAIRGGLSARSMGDGRSRGRMVTTREVKGIDQDVRLNRALWQLAESMARLKGAGSIAA